MQSFKFEDVAKEMTMIDVGGEAGRQLDITEARQALSCFLRFAANHLTLANVAELMAEYVAQAVKIDMNVRDRIDSNDGKN